MMTRGDIVAAGEAAARGIEKRFDAVSRLEFVGDRIRDGNAVYDMCLERGIEFARRVSAPLDVAMRIETLLSENRHEQMHGRAVEPIRPDRLPFEVPRPVKRESVACQHAHAAGVKTGCNAHLATAIERSDQAWQIHRRRFDCSGVKCGGECVFALEPNAFGGEPLVEKSQAGRGGDGHGLADIANVAKPNARGSGRCARTGRKGFVWQRGRRGSREDG